MIQQTATKTQVKHAKKMAKKLFKGFSTSFKSFKPLASISHTFNR